MQNTSCKLQAWMRAMCAGTGALLAGSTVAMADAPPMSERGLLPGDTLVQPAYNAQQDQSIARGGDQFLMVWSDYRSQGVGTTNQSAGDIFGIRLDANGQPIDPMPFAINIAPGEQRYPVVAWNGENWLVAFRSQDPTSGYYENRIRATRVSPQGQVLDATPLTIGTSDLPYRIAGVGGQWMVTFNLYHNDGYGTYIAGRRINSAGQFIDANPVMLLDWSYGQHLLLPTENEYLVIGPDWNNSSTIKARRINLNAQPVGSQFNLPSMTVATNGTEHYVVWVRNYVDLVGSRVTNTGALLTPSGVLLVSNINPYSVPSLTHDGTRWWMEWTDPAGNHTLRIDEAGNVIDPGGTPLELQLSSFRTFIGRGSGLGVYFAWWDSTIGGSDVWGVTLAADTTVGQETCVSTGTPTQRLPDLSNGPGGLHAVAFVSDTAFEDRVVVHLLSPAGDATTTEPLEVSRSGAIGKASIAWNGSLFLIVWDESPGGSSPTQIRGRRMDAEGFMIDQTPFDIMPGFSPDVAALGDDFLVASSRVATYPQTIYAQAVRIDGPTGMPLDSPFILLAGYVSSGPRVHAADGRWIVTYHSHWTHDSSQSDAVYNFVNADGTYTAARNPTTTSGGAGHPDVAFSGNRFLFVWRSNTLSNANNYISGRLMNPDGTFATG
ncbi:MAG: hypothetical protein JNG88_18260, partial [Phycisphaerales bacterium]|nr:hypothetical protein [Phycisphaerales bacterium]